MAKISHPWEQKFDMLGYNYRMINISAALGCSQIKQLDKILEKKRKITKFYKKIFLFDKNVKFFVEPEYCKSNYWHQLIIINESQKKMREYLKKFHKNKILTKAMWTPLHRLKYLRKFPRMNLSITEELFRRLIILPSGAGIIENRLNKVISIK